MKASIRKTIPGLKSYMEKHGYTGLFHYREGCGCLINDLAPCGEDHSNCELGWRVDPTPEEAHEFEFMVTNKKPK